ncbi:MAG: serine hydrolase [Candidatus Kaiserbacteria bacterium]|nr:serine hydrolase [Candidatus Kaiserbacteria bacterium]
MPEEQKKDTVPEALPDVQSTAIPIEQFMPSEPVQEAGQGMKWASLPSLALAILFLGAVAITLEYESTKHAPRTALEAAVVTAQDSFEGLVLTAKSAIVADMLNGKVLYSKNPDIQLPLASLTKVPLMLAVSEALPLETIITIPYDTAPKGSAERLAKGEKWSVKDVAGFTLIASSNAGAEILALSADRAIRERFKEAPEGQAALWRMNRIAQELGLVRTYFLNVSGLDVSATLSGAYGSAGDMAKLFAYAAKENTAVFAGTAEGGLLFTSPNGNSKTRAFNTNEALGDIPGLIMGKTGATDLAGGNLAIVFDVGPAHPIVAVVLGSTREGRFEDMKILIAKTQQAISQTNQ